MSESPWPEIDPSTFIHRMTFLQPVTSMTKAGTQTVYQAGNPPVMAYASVDEMNPVDVIRGGLDVSQVPTIIRTWYRANIATAQQRIQHPDGTVYVVKGAKKVKGVNVYLVFACIALSQTG